MSRFGVSKQLLQSKCHYTLLSENRCAVRLRYVDLVVSIDARGQSAQQLSEHRSTESVYELN
jgi:hypothetical protein